MIITELIENGKRVLHYSDQSFKILQVETGNIYESAIDVLPCIYTYEETDELIDNTEIQEEVDYIE